MPRPYSNGPIIGNPVLPFGRGGVQASRPRADESYRQALTIARENLSPAHPVRLKALDVSSRKESQLIVDSLRDHLKHWT